MLLSAVCLECVQCLSFLMLSPSVSMCAFAGVFEFAGDLAWWRCQREMGSKEIFTLPGLCLLKWAAWKSYPLLYCASLFSNTSVN